jgi:hypothetical protein
MHFRLPKPLHGWREFVGEVGIIVVGVLIALGAEQVVETVHERHSAAEARDNVRAEVRTNLDEIRSRLRTKGCIDRRLDELSAILARSGDGVLKPQPTWISRPPTGPFFFGRWQSATASGRNSLFAPNEQDRFAEMYAVFTRFDDYQAREQSAWSVLRALETWQGPLGPEARLAFVQALQQAKYLQWDLNYAGSFAVLNGRAMGLADTALAPKRFGICLPITTPRTDALKQQKSRFGEP